MAKAPEIRLSEVLQDFNRGLAAADPKDRSIAGKLIADCSAEATRTGAVGLDHTAFPPSLRNEARDLSKALTAEIAYRGEAFARKSIGACFDRYLTALRK